jgi:hypothetical protein
MRQQAMKELSTISAHGGWVSWDMAHQPPGAALAAAEPAK